MFELSRQFESSSSIPDSPFRSYNTGGNIFGSTKIFKIRSVSRVDSDVKSPDLSVQESAESPFIEPTVNNWKTLLESCDTLSKRYMLKPQKNNPVRPDHIPREIHGVCHANRTAVWAIVLLGLLRSGGNSEACQFTADEINALIKSALMHDAGREGEGVDQPEWERLSGDLCGQHLLATGHNMRLASQSRNAIIHKNDERTAQSPQKTLFESLLHDADCLEVMRVRNKYDIKKLDLYDPLGKDQCDQLSRIVREVIEEQGDLHARAEIIDSTKPCDIEQNKLAKSQCDQNADKDKKSYEYAVSPMLRQLLSLREKHPDLYQYVKNILGEIPEDILNSQHLYNRILNELASHREEGSASFASIYKDSVTGKEFNLTDCSSNIAAAKNQVLMSRLASMFGLHVPECHIITSANDSILAVEMLRTSPDPVKLTNLEKARLLVVCAWLGHNTIREEDLLSTANASIILSGWQRAGEFNGINDLTIKSFDENITELSLLLEVPLFSGINRSDIVNTVKELCESESIQSIGALVETFGPDAIAHRHRLRRTLYQRLSSLNFYYPESAGVGHISKAEEATINACGNKGHSFVFSFQDISGGEILFYQYLDQEKNPITACELKLNSDAGYCVSERFGLNDRVYNDLQEAVHFFSILAGTVFEKAFNRSTLTPAIKNEAYLQIQRIEQLKYSLNTMYQSGQMLEKIEGSFSTWINSLERVKSIFQIVANSKVGVTLITNADYYKDGEKEIVFDINVGNNKRTIIVPSFLLLELDDLSKTIKEQLTIFDSRISLICNENKAKSNYSSNNITTKNQYGYGFRKSAINSGGSKDKRELPHLSCAANALLQCDNKDLELEQIKIHWFPYDFECQAMTHTLILTTTAHAQSYRSLLQCVQQLGDIAIHRPAPREMQEEYLHQISHMPYYKSVEEDNTPDWMENHCRFNGQLRFYHPKEYLTEKNLKVRLVHALDFQNKSSQYQGYAGRRKQILDRMLNTESLLSSVERHRIGISEGRWQRVDICNGGGRMCYAGFYPDDPEKMPSFAMVMKPSVLRRADLTIFNRICSGNFNKQLIRLASDNYTESNIQKLVVDHHGKIGNSANKQAHFPMDVKHEVLLSKSISFNEVEKLIMPADATDYYMKTSSFISDMENWSDARPLDEVMPIKVLTLEEKKRVELYNDSIGAYLGVENQMGLDEFKEYMTKGVKYDFAPDWQNDVGFVLILLGEGPPSPLLCHTLENKRTDLFEYLLSLPDTRLDLKCRYHLSPLVQATLTDNSRALELILEKSPDIVQRSINPGGSFRSIIDMALEKPDILKVFMSKKSISADQVFKVWSRATTPLLHCIKNAKYDEDNVYYQSAKILLEHHANPDLKAPQEETSSDSGNPPVSDSGNPPVIDALNYKQFKLLKLLIDFGADVHATNNKGQSLISLLIEREKDSDGQKLIKELGLTKRCDNYRESSTENPQHP